MDAHFKSIDFRVKLAFMISVLVVFAGCAGDSYHAKPAISPSAPPVSATPPSPHAASTQEDSNAPSPFRIGDKGKMATLKTENRSMSYPEANGRDQAMQPQEERETPFTSLPKAKKSAQELLDSALEFCNASNDFWERGDLDNAVDALDEAYSLILQIDSRQTPEILQQRDDLRYTISQRVLQVYSSRFTVVNGYYKAIPLDMNPDVEKALQLLKGRERNFFINI